MEILHFCPSRSFSGLEQYALQLAMDQQDKGKRVGFVVAPDTELFFKCQESGIPTILFDPFSFGAVFKFWPKLVQILKNPHLKVVHLHSTQEIYHLSGAVFFQKLLKDYKPKVILQIHIWLNHRKKDPIHQFLYTIIDEVWCSSEPARQSLIKNLPLHPDKIRIVNYGRDIGRVETGLMNRLEARHQLGLPQDAVIVGTVSRLEESKGIRELFLAARPLLEVFPNLHLTVIGGPSPMDESAELYARGLTSWVQRLPEGLRERVHMLGPVPDSYRVLKAFDLYALPSFEECFSLSLLDAQLAGLPVVASQSGGTPEIVREGHTGWLFTPGDVNSLRQKLKEALDHSAHWEKFGQNASLRVRRDFNQETVNKNVLKYYETALR